MDADTTTGRTGHRDQLAAFETLETGVLVGTQMIAKGLDYPEITLVGIIAADSTLNIPEYSSAERTYQLLEQVSGRAGRGKDKGRVVIQTYQPTHPAIVAAVNHDRSIILKSELSMREELGYPPFVAMANIVVSCPDENKVHETARQVAEALRADLDGSTAILGPVPCALSKLKNRYRDHILIKCAQKKSLGPRIMEVLKAISPPADVRITVDIDPQTLS
jgi:primosomal protein N' (replication factor Y)